LYVLVGWGMLGLKAWARIVTLVFAGLGILGSLFGLATTFLHFNVFALFWIAVRLAIAGWVMWYLLQPNVSAAFQGGQARTASAYPTNLLSVARSKEQRRGLVVAND